MQKLAEICIERPVFATVLILTLVVVGAYAACAAIGSMYVRYAFARR